MDSFTPKSSFIEKAEYDEQARSMTVTFKTGSQTKYMYVFPSTWLSFKQSPDHSSYYSKAIKGKLMSINIIKHNVGKPHSTPLKQHRQKRSLTDGSIASKRNIHTAGTGSTRTAGTVARAFEGANTKSNSRRKDTGTKSAQ